MIVKGPQDIRLGNNTLKGIEDFTVEFEQDSEDYQTIQGGTYELDGPIKIGATATFLETDVPSLAVVVPQYYVPQGQDLSSGETVIDEQGAIDVRAAACDEDLIFNDLDIISCSNPANILRLKNVRTRVDSVEVDNKIRKVIIRFVGEPVQGEGVMQFFRQGGIDPMS